MTSDAVTFIFDDPETCITLADLSGKQLMSTCITSGESVSLRAYPAGIYLVGIRTAHGHIVRRVIRN